MASFGGNGPYQMLSGVRPAADRRSGPDQATTLASLQMIHEALGIEAETRFVTAGSSTAAS